jgi:hypothetical protein
MLPNAGNKKFSYGPKARSIFQAVRCGLPVWISVLRGHLGVREQNKATAKCNDRGNTQQVKPRGLQSLRHRKRDNPKTTKERKFRTRHKGAADNNPLGTG